MKEEEIKNFKKEWESYRAEWKDFDNKVKKLGWVKISETDRNCNTPVYKKDNEEIHLDINFGGITYVEICKTDNLIESKILTKEDFLNKTT